MSVLIKGLTMPEKGKCMTIMIFHDGTIVSAEGSEIIGHAVQVPPHGRLIDADAFTKEECNCCDGACEVISCDCISCKSDYRCEFMKDIANAPTIIPAEGEET